MTVFLFYLALITLLIWIAVGLDLVIGNRSIKFLKEFSPFRRRPTPKVSVIIPARNEERHIQEALLSVLNQDCEALEFIILNDRSTDQTGAILERMAQANPRLHVYTISELPPGWLGKNYTLYCGAQAATGEILLFTDADMVMQPETVRKAVHYLLENRLDHLTIASEVRMPGVLLGMFTLAFGIFFSLYARPWKVKNPKTKNYVGIGGFNMVRAEVYRAVGTHQAIAMRPDDDIKLGKLIKRAGYRQELVFGRGLIHVEWYSSLRELIEGLMKNSFASVDYSVLIIVASSIVQFTLNVWPFCGIFLMSGVTQVINIIIALVILTVGADTARFYDLRRWYSIGFPLCTLLFIYILWRSMLLTIFNDGISWRGTHYSLADLKANKV